MIETLVITGAHNHDWKRSAPFFKKLLAETGRFRVDLTENPSEALDDPAVRYAHYRKVLDVEFAAAQSPPTVRAKPVCQ